jgi:non-ribosomal peptide synthetase component F
VGSAEGAAHRAYWTAKLAGAPPEIRLGSRPRPPLPRQFLGAALVLELDPDLSDRLRALGGRHGATPFVTLLAGFRALLASALGARDVCIGTFMANRERPEVEALIGPLFNTVVLRSRVPEDATFARLLAAEREVLAAAHDHQAMPFEEVVEAVDSLAADRGAGRAPRCQILFASQHRAWDRIALAGLVAEPLHPPIRTPFRGRIRTARHDLAVHVVAGDRRLTLAVSHDEAVLDRGAVQDLCRRYRDLLAHMVADPDGLVGSFPGSSIAGVDSPVGA